MMMNDTIDSINTMIRQEEQKYGVSDYLNEDTLFCNGALHSSPVDEKCRSLMVDWCKKLCDFCKFSLDTASIAMSYADRFVSTDEGRFALMDRDMFQLVVMTSIYTAAKIHEPTALDPESVAMLSRGKFLRHEIEKMECKMLAGLRWLVNPPTATGFATQYLALISEHVIDSETRKRVLELAKYQIGLSLSEYELCLCRSSSVALAAVLNSLDSIVDVSDGMLSDFFEATFSGIVKSKEVTFVREQLLLAVSQQSSSEPVRALMGQQFRSRQTKSVASTIPNHHHSPRMVTMSIA